jgi:PE family
MSFVSAVPDDVSSAANDLAGIASTITRANSAAVQTTQVPAPAADQVSGLVAEFLNAHAQGYQAISAQAEDFHQQFVQALTAGGNAYATAEAANVETITNGQ